MPAGKWPVSLLLTALFALAGCVETGSSGRPAPTTHLGTATTNGPRLPTVTEVTGAEDGFAAYDLVQLTVDLKAEYANPFDQRQVALDAVFSGPDGERLDLPGFWDGEGAWLIRFTPPRAGEWGYQITVTDHRGTSDAYLGSVEVDASDHPGFLRIGDQVDPRYSSRYFAYEDGTAWYGRGHADLDMSLGGADPGGDGLLKFSEMADTGENYEMWWPMWGNNFIQKTYDDYSPAQMSVIDFVLEDAARKGIVLVYTIWGHQFLRTAAHDWPDDRWNFNGFSELTDVDGFFVDPEAWAWQENYYRYIIARWSYSPAIVMWQTVTEINGTESYDQTDAWHERVDAYFRDHDPYRHPTTATKSGAQDWPEGHAVMDVAQVHLYHVFGDNPVADTLHFAEWTSLMWEREDKPNWIGEYGTRVQALYPEFMHNADWVSLAAGAALTPTEWNDRNAFGTFDDAMAADIARFADFVDEVPLVTYDPDIVEIISSDPEVRGWGLASDDGGLIWLQDFALEEATIEDIRADETIRSGVVSTVTGLPVGTWVVHPYDTWSGAWLDEYTIVCERGPCQVDVPEFHADIALRFSR